MIISGQSFFLFRNFKTPFWAKNNSQPRGGWWHFKCLTIVPHIQERYRTVAFFRFWKYWKLTLLWPENQSLFFFSFVFFCLNSTKNHFVYQCCTFLDFFLMHFFWRIKHSRQTFLIFCLLGTSNVFNETKIHLFAQQKGIKNRNSKKWLNK